MDGRTLAAFVRSHRDWRVTYESGRVVVLRARSLAHALRRAGDGVLMVEDLNAAEVV